MPEVRKRAAVECHDLADDFVWGPPSWGPVPASDNGRRKRELAEAVATQHAGDERAEQAERKAEAALDAVRAMMAWMAKTEAERQGATARRIARLERLVGSLEPSAAELPAVDMSPETMAAIFGDDE